MVHGFFISMGGFVVKHGDILRPVASHDIGQSVSVDAVLDIEDPEIEDHSKGDVISKGLAFLQTLWFIIQCCARARQRLPLTELEVVTLAFAALNIVIRIIWWDKPLDVRYPITLKIEPTESPGLDVTKGIKGSVAPPRGVPKVVEASTTPTLEPDAIARPESGITEKPISEIKKVAKSHLSEQLDPPATKEPGNVPKKNVPTAGESALVKKKLRAIKTAHGPTRLVKWMKAVIHAVDHSIDVILMMFEGEEEDAYIRSSAIRVPTLWAGRLDKWQRGVAATIGIALAMTFGAIHFAAWNDSFPTAAESVLWKVAAILVVAVPFLFFVGATMVLTRGKLPSAYYFIVFNIIIPLGVITYVIARAILIFLPFISLRSLPPGTLKDVEWVSFIPHIG
jgi:hypothetical protein